MTTVDLDSVYKVTAKGRTYYYAWRGRGAPRLTSPPGSKEFVEELAAALRERHLGDKSKLGYLITSYKASEAWKKDIGDKTRQNWAPWLDKIRAKFGKVSIAAFERPKMRLAIRQWHKSFRATPRAADMGLQAFSRVLSFGVEEGELSTNLCVGIPHLYSNDRSEVIWIDADLDALEKVASPELMHAARLAAMTGLRKSDLLRLSWSHIKPLSIEITTGKSKNRKTTLIPLYGSLRAHLETIPKRSTRVLTNTDGVPWAGGFGSSWNKAVTRAGIDKHLHDLRGTAATKLYLAGFSIREIAEILTWSEDRVEALINRYVKRDELLRDRIRRMDEFEARTQLAKPSEKLSSAEG